MQAWRSIPAQIPKYAIARMLSTKAAPKSYLELAQGVDAVPHEPAAYDAFFQRYYKFGVNGCDAALGYVPEKAVTGFTWPQGWRINHEDRWLIMTEGNDVQQRTELFSETLQAMSDSAKVLNLDKPKGELLPVFGHESQHLMNIDRAGTIFFGTVSYGIQMLAYTRTKQGLQYWVPRRAKTKRSYPGMLDNCVGGALNTGETPLTCLMREANEEASLPEEFVRQHAKPFGVVSYHMATDGNGEEGHQPQVMYTYHIELTEDVVPTPSDGEVEKFELMGLDEVQKALKNGQFKTNCAATWLSYLIMMGVTHAENEPDLHQITTHLHRRLEFPVK